MTAHCPHLGMGRVRTNKIWEVLLCWERWKEAKLNFNSGLLTPSGNISKTTHINSQWWNNISVKLIRRREPSSCSLAYTGTLWRTCAYHTLYTYSNKNPTNAFPIKYQCLYKLRWPRLTWTLTSSPPSPPGTQSMAALSWRGGQSRTLFIPGKHHSTNSATAASPKICP